MKRALPGPLTRTPSTGPASSSSRTSRASMSVFPPRLTVPTRTPPCTSPEVRATSRTNRSAAAAHRPAPHTTSRRTASNRFTIRRARSHRSDRLPPGARPVENVSSRYVSAPGALSPILARFHPLPNRKPRPTPAGTSRARTVARPARTRYRPQHVDSPGLHAYNIPREITSGPYRRHAEFGKRTSSPPGNRNGRESKTLFFSTHDLRKKRPRRQSGGSNPTRRALHAPSELRNNGGGVEVGWRDPLALVVYEGVVAGGEHGAVGDDLAIPRHGLVGDPLGGVLGPEVGLGVHLDHRAVGTAVDAGVDVTVFPDGLLDENVAVGSVAEPHVQRPEPHRRIQPRPDVGQLRVVRIAFHDLHPRVVGRVKERG